MAVPPSQKILRFTGLSFLGSFIPWLMLAFLRQDVFTMPWFLMYGLGALAPSTIGLYLTYRDDGSAGLKNLFRGALFLRFPPFWYAVIFLLIPAINLAALYIDRLLGGPGPDFAPLIHHFTQPLSLLLLVLTTFLIGPFNEEFGWSGYAIEPFTARWGKAAGSLLLALVRFAWHIPMFFLVGTDQASRPVLPFMFGIVGLGLLCAWFYEGAGRYVSGPILAHFMYNLSIGSLLSLNTQAYWMRGMLYLTLSVALLIFFSRRENVLMSVSPATANKP